MNEMLYLYIIEQIMEKVIQNTKNKNRIEFQILTYLIIILL